MSAIITQAEFDRYAAAWAQFIDQAASDEVQHLFQAKGQLRQNNVSFDLTDSIVPLLSTVDIRKVVARFVLLPADVAGDNPRFRVVLYAADGLGGRISAYYLGTAAWEAAPTANEQPTELVLGEGAGLVSFSVAKFWLRAWATPKPANPPKPEVRLSPLMFMTSYGPLQGYTFEVSDFMDPLFPAKQPPLPTLQVEDFSLRLYFGLKSYYPAYPENLEHPRQTFGLVVRLFPPVGKVTSGDTEGGDTAGGSSYDMAQTSPPA
jgi:hypothetical protein